MKDTGNIKEILGKDPFHFTQAVSIELSNICNYNSLHKRCPAHYIKERKVMPLKMIEKILVEMGELGFDKTIFPFGYSEPLIDPRFYLVLDMIRKHTPKAVVSLYTNGFFVDRTILNELEERKVRKIVFSLYMPEEEKRIQELLKKARQEGVSVKTRATRRYPCERTMNDKIVWYERKAINRTTTCNAPLGYLTIDVDGDVVLCCHDWKRLHTFGSVEKQSLKEIITSDKMVDTFTSLQRGERYKLFLCARCTKHR